MRSFFSFFYPSIKSGLATCSATRLPTFITISTRFTCLLSTAAFLSSFALLLTESSMDLEVSIVSLFNLQLAFAFLLLTVACDRYFRFGLLHCQFMSAWQFFIMHLAVMCAGISRFPFVGRWRGEPAKLDHATRVTQSTCAFLLQVHTYLLGICI